MARNVFTRTLKSSVCKLTTRKPTDHNLSTEEVIVPGTFKDWKLLYKAAKKNFETPDKMVVDAELLSVVCKKYTMSIAKFVNNADKVEDANENEVDTEVDTTENN